MSNGAVAIAVCWQGGCTNFHYISPVSLVYCCSRMYIIAKTVVLECQCHLFSFLIHAYLYIP